MILTLFANGNSYLVFNHSSQSNQFNELNDYLLKLSILRESVVTTKYKLNVARKLNKLFLKLGYPVSLKRSLYSINSDTANIIRKQLKQLKHNNSLEISDNTIKKSSFMKYPNVEGCFFEENAHDHHTPNILSLSKNINSRNYYHHLTIELKVKCGLDDFSDYPNLFTIRNTLRHLSSMNYVSHNPTKLFSNAITEIKQQLLMLSNEINHKYIKIFINGQVIGNNEINNTQLLDIVANTITSSNGLIGNILKLQASSAGQQFLAHVIYLLLDIFYQYSGHLTDSWKIYYLQRFKTFNISPCDIETNIHLSIQIGNFKKGIFLIKTLLSLLITMGHIELNGCLIFFSKKFNQYNKLDTGITYHPLVKLRDYLERYSRKGYPNISLHRTNSFKSLFVKYNIVRDSIRWLQNFFIGRTMMDCSLIYNIQNAKDNHPSTDNSMEKHHIYNELMPRYGYTMSNNQLIKISLVDLDIKPYRRVGKWANDTYIAIKRYRSTLTNHQQLIVK